MVSFKKHFGFAKVVFKAIQMPILVFFALAGNGVTFGAAFLFYIFEKSSNPEIQNGFDAIWWAFCTVTTVGFGDIVPVTTEGRLIGMGLMVTGIIFFVGYTAILVSVVFGLTSREIVELEVLGHREYRALLKELESLKADLKEIKAK